MMMIILSIVVMVTILIIMGVILLVINKKMEDYAIIKRHAVDVNNPELVDSVIVRGQPTAFKVGKKYLYLQPATIDQHNKFMSLFERFVMLHSLEIKNIELLTFKEALNKDESRDKITKDSKQFLSQRAVAKTLDLLIRVAFLNDKNINPQKINSKYYRQHATIDERLQLFFLTISLNVDSVANFIEALTNRNGRASNNQQDQRIFGSGLWASTKSASKKQVDTHSLKPFYYHEENPNAPKRNEISSKENKIKQSSINS